MKMKMKTLIAEDDLVARFMLKELLSEFGPCDTVGDGREAVDLFAMALDKADPYRLVCLDILMPEVDGQQVLAEIRAMEKERRIKGADEVKVIMITAVDDPKSVFKAYYHGGATSYIVKPIDKRKLLDEIRLLGLIR